MEVTSMEREEIEVSVCVDDLIYTWKTLDQQNITKSNKLAQHQRM